MPLVLKNAGIETVIELRLHSEPESPTCAWKKGVTVDFPVKPGRVTFARLGEVKGVYRLIVMGGEALPPDLFVRGNTLRVRMDTNVTEVLEKTIREGHEHHHVLAHGDLRDELSEVGKLLGIRTVLI